MQIFEEVKGYRDLSRAVFSYGRTNILMALRSSISRLWVGVFGVTSGPMSQTSPQRTGRA